MGAHHNTHHHHSKHRNGSSRRKQTRLVLILITTVMAAVSLILGVKNNSLSFCLVSICTVEFLIKFSADYMLMETTNYKQDEYRKKKFHVYAQLFSNIVLLIGVTLLTCIVLIRMTNKVDDHINALPIFICSSIYLVVYALEILLVKNGNAKHTVGEYMKVGLLSTLTVSIFSLAIIITKRNWIDYMSCLLLEALLVYQIFKNFSSIVNSILAGANKDSLYRGLTREIMSIRHIESVHHLHVWNFRGGKSMLVCHVKIDEAVNKEISEEIISAIKGVCNDYNINYETVQIESAKEK